jgi:hypothetical protein
MSKQTNVINEAIVIEGQFNNFQTFQGENKFLFDETMMIHVYVLHNTNMLI